MAGSCTWLPSSRCSGCFLPLQRFTTICSLKRLRWLPSRVPLPRRLSLQQQSCHLSQLVPPWSPAPSALAKPPNSSTCKNKNRRNYTNYKRPSAAGFPTPANPWNSTLQLRAGVPALHSGTDSLAHIQAATSLPNHKHSWHRLRQVLLFQISRVATPLSRPCIVAPPIGRTPTAVRLPALVQPMRHPVLMHPAASSSAVFQLLPVSYWIKPLSPPRSLPHLSLCHHLWSGTWTSAPTAA
jgi:hypothetical protein